MVRTRKRKQSSMEVVVDESAMANLPTHILVEIISKLPIKAVMALRCVSKSLLNLISEPYFKELHSTRAPTELFLRHSDHFNNILHIAEPVFRDDHPVAVAVDMKFSLVLDLPNFSVRPKNDLNFKAARGLSFVNACNGLVCYCGPINRFAVICNPITGEYVTLPGPDKDKTIDSYYDSTLYGLGFSSKDNKFKLLRLLLGRSDDGGPVIRGQRVPMVAEIYTFGETGSWNIVADCPDVFYPLEGCTFYEGVVHWYSQFSGDILTYDFDSEEFGKINSPYSWDEKQELNDLSSLGVLGDRLYKTASAGDCVDVWVMREYGVQSSWIKAYSIQSYTGRSWRSYKPIKYLQNGEILMRQSCHEIVCYNPDTASVRSIGSSGHQSCEAISMRPSLVSLKALLGDNVKARNVKSRVASKKLSEVAGISPWWTRLRLLEDTEEHLRWLQEQHARGCHDHLYPIRIKESMALLHRCRNISPRTAAEPHPAATDSN